MTSHITYEIPVTYRVKVNATSSELSEDELRKLVQKAVDDDLARDSSRLNGYAGCITDDNRTYSYSYEAGSPIKQ